MLLTLLGVVLFSDRTFGAKRYEEEEEELVDPKLAQNRAASLEVFDTPAKQAVRSKQAPLLATFKSTTKQVDGDGQWKQRAIATLWYDAEDKLISVEVENSEATDLEQTFAAMCDEGALYQLQIPEFDLLTTQPACTYKERGLNETLTFYTDIAGKNLVSFSYNVSESLPQFVTLCIEPVS